MGTFTELARLMPGAVHELGANHEEWAKKALLDWEIKESEVAFTPDGKRISKFEKKKIFFRSDTEEPLAVVGKRFKPVQPKAILDFYGGLADKYGFKLAIAGETEGGAKIWAMAETPHHLEVARGDKVGGALFLMTACDGSLSTQAYFTSFRMWCKNQLPVLNRLAKRGAFHKIAGSNKRGQVFRMTHSTHFSPERIEHDLELMETSWSNFRDVCEKLANKKVTREQAIRYFQSLYYTGEQQVITQADIDEMKTTSTLVRVLRTYEEGEGQKDIKGTAWGLVNAVTRYMDHETRAKDDHVRVKKAWIDGSRDKAKALELAMDFAELNK